MTDFLYRHRWMLTALVIGVVGVALHHIGGLTSEVRLSDFFPERDPDYDFYLEVREALGAPDDILTVALTAENGLYEPDFLHELAQFTVEVESLETVESVRSISTLRKPIATPFGLQGVPYLRRGGDGSLRADSALIANDRALTAPFVNRDGRIATAVVVPRAGQPHESTASLIADIDGICSRRFGDTCHLGGLRYLEVHYAHMSKKSLKSVAGYSLVLIVLVITLLFRSPVGFLLPMLVVICSAIAFGGYLVMIDRPLGVTASIFPTLILIVGLSDVIHLLSRHDFCLERERTARAALLATLREVGPALLLTSLTTAVGLLTFTQSDMRGLRQFGFDSAVAVVVTLIVTVCVSPLILTLRATGHADVMRPWYQRVWALLGDRIGRLANRRPNRILGLAALVTAVAVVGATRITTNSRLAFRFSGNPDLADDIQFFEEHLGGIRQLQLAVRAARGRTINEPVVLAQIEELHDLLERDTLFGRVTSPVTFYSAVQLAQSPFGAGSAGLSRSSFDARRLEPWAAFFERQMPFRLVDKTRSLGMVVASMPDIGRNDVADLTRSLDDWAGVHLDTSLVSFRPTGIGHLIDRGHLHRINNMFLGLLIAVSVVALLVALVLRSARMMLVALLVNLLPLVWTAGLMGWLSIELRGSTSMIFAVGFVIAVDDTLHFMISFARRQRSGSQQTAVRDTIAGTGRGIVATSLALLAAFSVLTVASFWEIQMFGLLVSFLLASALPADLIVLPALIHRLPEQGRTDS